MPKDCEERAPVVLPSRRPQIVLVEFVNTLADPTVFDQLYKLAQKGGTEFHLLMPIVRPDYGLAWAPRRPTSTARASGSPATGATGQSRDENVRCQADDRQSEGA